MIGLSAAAAFFNLRQRRGVTKQEAWQKMLDRNYFGAMMVHLGDADGFVSGLTQSYPETVRPALQIIGTRPGVRRAAGLILLAFKDGIYFFADTTEKAKQGIGQRTLSFCKQGQQTLTALLYHLPIRVPQFLLQYQTRFFYARSIA